MGRFVEGADRSQLTLLPECLEDWVSEDNAVHVIDVFVEALDLHGLGFERVIAKETGRPSYHPRRKLRVEEVGNARGRGGAGRGFCWIPVEDLQAFLNTLPGPPLTKTDVEQRLRAICEEPHAN